MLQSSNENKGLPLVTLKFLSYFASFVYFAPACCDGCNDYDKTIIEDMGDV